MDIKLIAIGNKLMMDDGIGVRIAEKIRKDLANKGIKVIIGETDFEYCLNNIDDGGFLLILDSTYFGKPPGSISLISLNELEIYKQSLYSQHQMNLIDMLNIYKKDITGWFIGIEIGKVDLGVNLSDCLESNFNKMCDKVKKIIINIMEGVNNA